jgi:hypothetical protein
MPNLTYPPFPLPLTGEDTYWDDLDFAITIRSIANEGPTLVDVNGTGIFAYAFSNGKLAYFQRQIPHKFKVGQSAWRPHVHWMPTTTAQYTGTFTLEYVTHNTVNPGLSSPLSAKGTRTGTFDVAATAWHGHLTPLNVEGAIDGSDWTISTIIFAKLTVALSSGTSVILSGMDWHGQLDSFGSAEEYVK